MLDHGAFSEGVTGPAQYGDRLRVAAGLSPCPAIDSRGSNGRGARRSHRRRWPLRGQGRNGRAGACAGRRADRRPHPRRACAASTRRACESAARRNGCIRRPPKPSHFTAPAPSVARCRKASKAAASSMTVSSPIAIWTALRGPMRSATLTTCANSKPSLRSTMSPGRQARAIVSATPARRSGRPAPREKRRSRPPRSKPSMPATGRLCAKVSPGTAACRGSKRPVPKAAGRNRGPETICCSACTGSNHVLRFPVDFDAPFTNNLAERLRPLFPSGSRSRALAANLIPALCVRPFSYRDLFCAQMIDSNP